MTTRSVSKQTSHCADRRLIDEVFASIPRVRSAGDLARDGIFED